VPWPSADQYTTPAIAVVRGTIKPITINRLRAFGEKSQLSKAS